VISPQGSKKKAEQRLPGFIAKFWLLELRGLLRRSTALEQHVLMYVLSMA
jgi:hypothetical protein